MLRLHTSWTFPCACQKNVFINYEDPYPSRSRSPGLVQHRPTLKVRILIHQTSKASDFMHILVAPCLLCISSFDWMESTMRLYGYVCRLSLVATHTRKFFRVKFPVTASLSNPKKSFPGYGVTKYCNDHP